MTFSAIAISFLLVLQTGKGSIEGTVVSSTTNKPIAGAQVTAMRMGAVPAPPTAAGPAGVTGGVLSGTVGGIVIAQGGPLTRLSASTDSSGRFVFQDLEPGRYMVQAGADGYASQQVGPPPEGQTGMSATVNVSGGQATASAVLHLTPGGNLSGRVTGGNGEPLAGMEVTLLRLDYSIGGRRNVGQIGSAQTNDRGEYRLFWVAPGRYYVSVGPSNRPFGGSPIMPSTANNKYPRTFYPGATNIDGASQIDIQPGGEMAGIDFRLAQQPAYRVRGRVVDATTGQIPRSASISITPRDSVGVSSIFQNAPYNPADGTFELRDVIAGSYWVRAQLPLPAGAIPAGGPIGPLRPQVAVASIEVRGSDVENVMLAVLPPISISGRVRIEGQSATASIPLRISLQPATTGLILGPMPAPATVNPDGTFQIANVTPGEYQVSVQPIGPGAPTSYVKEARLGAVDVMREVLTIDGPVTGELQVVVGSTAGQVSGTVSDDRQQLSARTAIVLVPDQRDRRDMYRTGVADASGHFTMRQVPPGTYKAFAVDQSQMTSFFDPAVMRKYEQAGRSVIVGDSANVSVDLKVIR